MRSLFLILTVAILGMGFYLPTQDTTTIPKNNPYFGKFNERIDFAGITTDHIIEATEYIFGKANKDFNKIRFEPNPNFNNIFVAFDDIINDVDKVAITSYIMSQVHPDSAIRAEGKASYEKLEPLGTDYYSDKKVYQQITAFSKTKEYAGLADYRKKFIDDLIIDFEQSGVGLSEENLEKMKTLNNEINKLTSDFTKNLNNHKDTLFIDEVGTNGLPENYKEAHRVADNKYQIVINNASSRTFLANAKSEALRKKLYFKYGNIAADQNVVILEQLAAKRYKLAQVMGKASMANMILESRMAANPENVWNFLDDLFERSMEKGKRDYEEVKQIRNVYLGTESTEDINVWDYNFYRNMLFKEKYQLDKEKIREYFSMDLCLDGMFKTYQKLLGLKFTEVRDGSLWHEEARMFEVRRENQLIGRFYLDLFPRPNKNTHAYQMTFAAGKATNNGYQLPTSLLLTNFTRPTKDKPSLISHRELRTLYHEFGHVMNMMAYDGELAIQSQTKRDFVEAMSQIFENWIWDYDILSSFAKHYQTGEVLPKEVFDKMVASKNVGSGINTLLRVGLCYYDMTMYHKYDPQKPLSTIDIWKEVDKKRGFYPTYVEGTHREASWIHINGYPVYYYGYLWSRVFAQDMFTNFEQNGLLDTETGKRYSKLIMANGSRRDINAVVTEFLGRESNNGAFIKSLGLDLKN